MAREFHGKIPRVPIDADTSKADAKIDRLFQRIDGLKHIDIDANVNQAQRRLETMVKRTNEQMSKELISTMTKDMKIVLGAMKSEYENLGDSSNIYKNLEKTCNMVEDRFSNLTITVNKKSLSGLENILNNVSELQTIDAFSFDVAASKQVVKNTEATFSTIKAARKEINSIAGKVDYIQKALSKGAKDGFSTKKLEQYQEKIHGLEKSLQGFYSIDDELIQNALVNAAAKINDVLGEIDIKMPKVKVGVDSLSTGETAKNLAAVEKKSKAIQEVTSRISKNSGISGIKNLEQEAVNTTKILAEMYDEGIRDTERYITLQYRLSKIFDKMGDSYGGIKGSGSKNKSELIDLVIDGIYQRTGENIVGPNDMGRVMENLFGSSDFSLFNKSLSKMAMKDIAELLLLTGKAGDWVDMQTQVTAEVEKTADAYEKTADVVLRTQKEINEELQKEKQHLKDIEDQERRNEAAREYFKKKQANYGKEVLGVDHAVYDTDLLKGAAKELNEFNELLETRNKFQEKYIKLCNIIEKYYVNDKPGKYSIGNGVYKNLDDFFAVYPDMERLEKLSENGQKTTNKTINELFKNIAKSLKSDGDMVATLLASGEVSGALVGQDLDREEVELNRERQRLYDARIAQENKVGALKREELDLIVEQGKEEAKAIKEATEAKRKYYEIDEKAARLSKQMRSFDDYKEGSATASYKAAVDELAAIVEEKKKQFPDKADKLDQLLDRYAKNLAAYINRDNQIGAQYPSVMISGAGNYNIKKHNKQMASWGKNFQFYEEKVAALENKIKSMGGSGTEVIRGDEEDALERLEAKVEYMKYWHQVMVEANKYYKKNKTLEGFEGAEPDEIERIKKSLADVQRLMNLDTPFPSYTLTNDSQNIKRLEGRISELKHLKNSDNLSEENEIYRLWADKKDMRIRISFEIGKPDQEVIDMLKGKAFKWSPKNNAWQRQLTNNAVYETKLLRKSLHAFYNIKSQAKSATEAIEAQTEATEQLAEARLKLTPKKDGSGAYTAMDGKYEIQQDAEGWKVHQRDNAGLWNLIGTYKHFEDIKNDVSLLTREEIVRTDEVIQEIQTLQEAYQSLRTETGGYIPVVNKYIEVLDKVKNGAMSAADATGLLNEVAGVKGLSSAASDTIARTNAMAEFAKANEEILLQNHNSESFMKKYEELAKGILSGDMGVEDANKQLQEFVSTLSKIEEKTVKFVPIHQNGKETAWGGTEDILAARNYVRNQNGGFNLGTRLTVVGSEEAQSVEKLDKITKQYNERRQQTQAILDKEKLTLEEILYLLKEYNQMYWKKLSNPHLAADAVNLEADIERKFGRATQSFAWDNYLSSVVWPVLNDKKVDEQAYNKIAEKIANQFGVEIPQAVEKATENNKKLTSSYEGLAAAQERELSKMTFGNSGETLAGTNPINFKYAVMSVEDLIMSHDAYGNVNSNYPEELQPRDRSRMVSRTQIEDIVKNIMPELLVASPTAQNGSPIVNNDGIVVGGNARSAALLKAYEVGRADGYKSYITEHASEFGLDPNNMPKNPVLVRVVDIDGGLDVLAKQLNESTTAGYSAAEQAIVNEELIMKVISKLNIDESANLNSEANRDFVKSFISLLPENQKNEMMTKDGSLSAVGLVKVKQALASAAYGSKEMLENLEQISPELLNISNALMAGAAKAANARYAVESGELNDFGVVSTLLNGVDLLKTARHNNQSIEEYMNQLSLFGSDYSAEDIAIGKFLEANIRNATQLKNMVDMILDSAMDAGDPNQISFDGMSATTLSDLIRSAFTRYASEYQKDIDYDSLISGHLPAEIGSRSDKRVDRTDAIDDTIEAKKEQIQLTEQATSAAEEQAVAEEKVAVAAERTANALNETKASNNVSVEDIVERNISEALAQLRSAKDNETTLFSLKGVFDGEDLVDQAQQMIENIAAQANLSVANFTVKDDIIKVKLYNDELKVTVDQIYKLKAATEEMDSAQLELFSQSFSQNVKALNENKFDVEGVQQRALAAVEKVRSSLHGLEYDLTGLESAAKNISSQDDFNKFNNQLKAAQDNIQAIKNSTVSKSSMNPLANMQRDMQNASIEIETMRLKLEKFGDIQGVDKAKEMLADMAAAAEQYNKSTDAQGQQNAYNQYSNLRSSFKAQTEYINAAKALNDSQKSAERQTDPIKNQYKTILDLVNKINAANERMIKFQSMDGGSGLLTKQIAEEQQKKLETVEKLNSVMADLNIGNVLGKEQYTLPDDVKSIGTDYSQIAAFINDAGVQASLTSAEIEKLVNALVKAGDIDLSMLSEVLNSGSLKERAKQAARENQYFSDKTSVSLDADGNTKTRIEDIQKLGTESTTAKEKLEEMAQAIAKNSEGAVALTKNFSMGADGIARLDFSVFNTNTGEIKDFTAALGTATGQMGVFETTVDKLQKSKLTALKQIETAQSTIGRLGFGSVGLEDSSTPKQIADIVAKIGQLREAMKTGDQNLITQYTKDLQEMVKGVEKADSQMRKMQSAIESGQAMGLGNIDSKGNIYGQLTGKIQELAKIQGAATFEVGKFDQATNTLNASLVYTNGTVEQVKVSMYGLNGECAAQQVGVGKLTTTWDRFKASIGQAGKQLLTAFAGYNVFYKAISEVRKGIGYVKEIDLALTELKKVTDETEESYAKFLNTAAGTAGEIGSTVSDFTEASANFARLGYTMEESADMAKTAIVYRNVADGLDTVDEATDSIISTMKAFGIESNDTMGIIDRFNEVGKYVAQVV